MEQNLRIIELTAENVKRLRAVTIRPDGNFCIIGGRNGQGKSSVLDAILYALGGTKDLPPKPVREGEDEARIEIDLGEFIVVRTIPADGTPSLIVKSREGARYPSPQAMLDKLLSNLSFDPLEFTRQKPADQSKTLMRLVGLDFSKIDTARKVAFDERTNVNRDAKAAKANLDAAPRYPDAPEAEVAVQSVMAELDAANATLAANAKVRRDAETVESRLRGAMATLEGLMHQVAEANDAVDKWKGQMALATKAVAALADPDVAPIRERIAAVDQDNAKVRANAAHAKLAERAKNLDGVSAKLSKKIADLDAERETMAASATYPVPGLSVGDDGILLNGIPLEQASSAEQLRVSAAIGLALNPRLKLLTIRDGSLLDSESLALLAQLAEANGAQLLVERVGKADEGAIIIEDGMVEKAPTTPAETETPNT